MNYFNQNTDEVIKALETSRETGLTFAQAEKNREKYGANVIAEEKSKSVFMVFLEQFADLLVIILIITSIISAFTGNIESTIVILAVITMNAILGTVQHVKAQKSLASLKAMSAPNARVIRDGKQVEIPASEVVVGDILLVEAGNVAAADGRILEAASLQVNESALTGESLNVLKSTDKIDADELPLGDRVNMIYSGSNISNGRGVVAVTGVGSLPLPFTPVHLLFINLLTDSLPALALCMEPKQKGIMREKPRSSNESIHNKETGVYIIVHSIMIAACVMVVFMIGNQVSGTLASTMAFATLCLARLFEGFDSRGKYSLFSLGVVTNVYSIGAFAAGIMFLAAALFISPLYGFMDIDGALSSTNIIEIAALAVVPFAITQLLRVIREAITKK